MFPSEAGIHPEVSFSTISDWERECLTPDDLEQVALLEKDPTKANARAEYRQNVTTLIHQLETCRRDESPLTAAQATQRIIAEIDSIIPPSEQFPELVEHLAEVERTLQELEGLFVTASTQGKPVLDRSYFQLGASEVKAV